MRGSWWGFGGETAVLKMIMGEGELVGGGGEGCFELRLDRTILTYYCTLLESTLIEDWSAH